VEKGALSDFDEQIIGSIKKKMQATEMYKKVDQKSYIK